MLWVLIFGAILLWAPPAAITHRTHWDRGVHGQIKPKPCWVNGVEGTCMFVYECIKSEGRSVGMCVDNFMFGSCCSHNVSTNDVIPPSPQNQPNLLYTQTTTHSSLRPQSLAHGGTKPYSSPGSSLSALSALGSKVRPSKPASFVTRTTKRPAIVKTTTSRPSVSLNIRPWTQKPPAFVTSTSTDNSAANRPASLGTTTSSPSSTSYASVYDLIATSKPTSPKFNGTTMSSVSQSSTSTTQPFTLDTAASSTWITSKPGWSSYPSHNELFTTNSGKPDVLTSGKPNSYVSRPSWQAPTESFFVTRPRPSSNLTQRPRPTRRPVTSTESSDSTTLHLISSSSSTTVASTSTSTSQSTSTTPRTTTSTTTTTTTASPFSLSPDTQSSITSTLLSSSSLQTTTLLPTLSNYQYNGECGMAALLPRPEMRIVGGKNAAFGAWPWQVSVRRTSFFGFSSTHRCGGALINENWIATAGHCVDDLLTSQIRIRVGEYDFASNQEPFQFVERGVAKKIVHPKYNFYTYEYDLALVKLEAPLEFQPHISPICLPASDDLLIGENATVTGWGRLSEGGTLPSVLQQVSVPIVSNEKCKSMFLRAGRHEFIPEIFLCAGYDTGGQDSCQGDSGGPLQVKGKNGRYFLAGIISWGIGCAEANLPGVCTRISKFVPWILENVT